MKTGMKITLGIVALVALLLAGGCRFYVSTYNAMVTMSEGVEGQWAQVENQYQRRLDLIPNLVATVKGYAAHEAQVFEEVASARSRAGGVLQVSDEVLSDPAAFERFQAAQAQLGGALQRLLAVAESYPELKANENFLALQDQLEGTENRIAVERNRFNEAVRAYNAYLRRIPQAFVAGVGGFAEKAYFAADPRAASAPAVSF
jgi:LemA protein